MNKTFSLYRLQLLDTQRIQRLKRIRFIDQTIASDKALMKARRIVEKAAREHAQSESAVNEIQRKVEEKTLKLKLTQSKLFGGKISNTKELQDLQAESEALTRNIKKLEEEHFQALEIAEKTQAILKRAESNLQSIIDEKATENSLLLGEREKLLGQLPKINSLREALRAQLDPSTLEEYSKLFKNKAGLAVVEIVDDACKACGVELSPNEIQQAARPEVLLKCKSCGRILYKPDISSKKTDNQS